MLLDLLLAIDSEDSTPVMQSLRWDMIPRLILMQVIHKICLVLYFYILVTIIQGNKSENDKMLGICSDRVPCVQFL